MAADIPPTSLPPPNQLIILAEAQWLFSESDLLHAPSITAGLSPTQERENRAKGVNFILQVGIMLKLPQITLATASVFLHRFFMRYSMIEDRVAGRQHQHYYSIAATCLFLATKVEENCRKMKDLVVACVRVAQKEPNKEVDEQDKEFWRWRDVLLQLEDLLLEALCFDLSLESPYKLLYTFLVHFQEENNKPLRNAAWAFVNDSCLTPLCLLYPARTIAASAIYAAARHCEVKLLDDERGRPWWKVAGSDLTSIRKACNYMASLYENVATSGTNGDSGKNAIYQHTPESGGEERFAKTRAYRPGVSPQDSRHSSPLSGPLNHTQPLQSTQDREPMTFDTSTPQKRPRDSDTSSSATKVDPDNNNNDDYGDGEEEGEIQTNDLPKPSNNHKPDSNNHYHEQQYQQKRQRTLSPDAANRQIYSSSSSRDQPPNHKATNGTKSKHNNNNNNHTSSDHTTNGNHSHPPDKSNQTPSAEDNTEEGYGSEEGEL